MIKSQVVVNVRKDEAGKDGGELKERGQEKLL